MTLGDNRRVTENKCINETPCILVLTNIIQHDQSKLQNFIFSHLTPNITANCTNPIKVRQFQFNNEPLALNHITDASLICIGALTVLLYLVLVLVLKLYLSTFFGYWYWYLYLHAKYWYLNL